jgi:AcrR family transcriptional regulator
VRRPRAKRGEGDKLREEILVAASELLAKSGDEEAVSIRAVAHAVGVTPPSIYLHFADKDELLFAVCTLQFRTMGEYQERAVEGVDDPSEQLFRRALAYVQFGIDHPEHYRLLFMSHRATPVPEHEDAALQQASGFTQLVGNVHALLAAGLIAEEDPLVVASGLWALVHGVTALAITQPAITELGVERLLRHMTSVYGRGLFRT